MRMSFLTFKHSEVDVLENAPTPKSDRINVFQVTDPIQHQLDTLRVLLFESKTAELLSDIHKQAIVLGHMEDEENAKEVLRPAK